MGKSTIIWKPALLKAIEVDISWTVSAAEATAAEVAAAEAPPPPPPPPVAVAAVNPNTPPLQ